MNYEGKIIIIHIKEEDETVYPQQQIIKEKLIPKLQKTFERTE